MISQSTKNKKGIEHTTSLVSLGVVPVQKRKMPSSVNIRYAQWNELRYCARASRDCIRVLITLPEKSVNITRERRRRHWSRKDSLKRHSSIHSDQPRNPSNAKRDRARQGLARARGNGALYELFERRVRREADSWISALAHHLRGGRESVVSFKL